MASQVLSIRLDDEAIEALRVLQIDDETLHTTAKRILLASLGIDVNVSVQNVNNASNERIQELIDSKVAYIATAMNDLKQSLENEIEVLKNRLDDLTQSPAATTATAVTPKATQPKEKNSLKK